jgi:hypothetical protein
LLSSSDKFLDFGDIGNLFVLSELQSSVSEGLQPRNLIYRDLASVW